MSELWAFILSLLGLNWERPKRVSDLLNNWSGLCGMKTYSTIWGLFLRVYYGLFGGKRIFELLKGQNANLFNLNLRFLGLCLSGSTCIALLSLQVQTFWPFWTVCLLLDSLC